MPTTPRRVLSTRPPGDPVEKVDADGAGGVGGVGEEVEVVAGGAQLGGELSVPAGARGLVVFVHGSGSSRHSPRNRYVAGVLQAAGLATLLFDLLTRREELDRATVFDVGLLAGRLIELTSWVRAHPQCRGLRVGYFGASTGAAAALWAATTDPAVAAVVPAVGGWIWRRPVSSRCGRRRCWWSVAGTRWCWRFESASSSATARPRRSPDGWVALLHPLPSGTHTIE